MVLCLKARESRSLPGLKNTVATDAGWSSLVARQAHNLKVAGSNPAPATKKFHKTNTYERAYNLRVVGFSILVVLFCNIYCNFVSGLSDIFTFI